MILFWLSCVVLVLAGLAARREARAALEDLRLHLFGVRVRVVRPARPAAPVYPAPPSGHDPLPPFRVATRPGP